MESLEARRLLTTFTVTNTNDSGAGSLRQAMLNANAASGADVIQFNIPGPGGANGVHTIRPLSQLPIVNTVTIDGYTQPGSSVNTNAADQGGTNAVLRVEIDGTLAGSVRGITGGSGNTIRGLVINRFRGPGIELFGTSGANRVEGCFVGTDPSGAIALPNNDGVKLHGTHTSVVGGTTPAARNLLSGNTGVGVGISAPGSAFFVGNNVIQGNLIGTDATGTRALGNGTGVDMSGGTSDAPNNLLGGTAAAARNVVSGNRVNGVQFSTGVGTLLHVQGSSLQGNYIGTDVTGTQPLGNAGNGVFFSNFVTDVIVGGTTGGAGNLIAFNAGRGVAIGVPGGAGASRIAVLANRIAANGGLGIDLGANGVSPNDGGDGDVGPNTVQNFPVLVEPVVVTATGTTVRGSLNSTPGRTYRLEFFDNAVRDPSSYGEGEQFLGSTEVTTDASGNAAFEVAFPVVLPGSHYVTATATSMADHDNNPSTPLVPQNTSEFSGGVLTEQRLNRAPTADAGADGAGDEGAPIAFDGRGSSDPDGDPLSYFWDFGDGATSTDPAPSHAYADDGTYTVTLTVEDGRGLAATDALEVMVVNASPTATFTSDGPVAEGSPATVSFASPYDPSAADTAAGFTYSYDFNNDGDFDDPGDLLGVADASASFAFPDDGTYTVRGRITDKDGGFTDYTTDVGVTNVNPTVAITGAPESSPEGTAIVLGSEAADPGEDTFDYAWSVTKDGAPYAAGAGAAVAFTPDDNGTYVVTLAVTDDDGGAGGDSRTITVTNVDPLAAVTGAPETSVEGTAVLLGGTVADPGSADTHAYAWSVTRDGAAYAAGAGPGFAFTPDDDGTYVVTLVVTDDDGGTGTDSRTIAVSNAAPADLAITLSPAAVNEGDTVVLGGSFADPGAADAHTVVVHWEDGTATTLALAPGVTTFTAAHCVPDDAAVPAGTPSDVMPVSVEVTDDDGATEAAGASMTVHNVAPSVAIHTMAPAGATGPFIAGGVYAVGTPMELGGSFTDPGLPDTHSFRWVVTSASLAGPVEVAGTVTPGGHSVTSVFTPTAAGVYHLKLVVTDDDGGAGEATTVYGGDAYFVIYDPAAGHVSGGGWIDSPAGAYAADPTLSGRATFGFVSRYQRGAAVPTGQTEFQFKLGDLNFHSTSYEWLVVSGGRKAQYKGSGTVNGRGDYGFILTAIDGGAGGVDRFRIKIWDKSTGQVVYDNKPGSPDDELDGTALGGGNILIQS